MDVLFLKIKKEELERDYNVWDLNYHNNIQKKLLHFTTHEL